MSMRAMPVFPKPRGPMPRALRQHTDTHLSRPSGEYIFNETDDSRFGLIESEAILI